MGFFTKDYDKVTFRNKKKDRTIQEQHAELLKGGLDTTAATTTTTTNGILNLPMVINKGQDDEMFIYCYKASSIKMALTYLSIILTLGLLRLVFHWVPHWYIYATCKRCTIDAAQKILIKEIFKEKHTIYHVKELKVLTPQSVDEKFTKESTNNIVVENDIKDETIVQIGDNPGDTTNDNQISTLSVHYENGEFRELEKLLFFTCKKVTYIWDQDKREFVRLKGLDQGIASSVLHQNRGLSTTEQFMRRLVYGPNKIDIKEKSIAAILFLEVLNPFYIFQIASFILWFIDNYYYYAAAIMIMSIYSISMSVRQTRKNQTNLKSTVHSSDVCTVVRKKIHKNHIGDCGDQQQQQPEEEMNGEEYTTETISTELLVPGDILVIPAHGCIMHCDAILLTGNCILNESMLTGESVPVTKTSLPNHEDVIYDTKEHARHTLFCGTKVIQTRYFGNEQVLAVVVRTGFSTAKGSLVRSMLYPPPVDFRFEKDSYRFTILLAGIAVIGFLYTVITKVLRGIDPRDLIVEALDLITIVVPPALPAAMTVGRMYAQQRLKRNNIFCISPRTINVAGSIDCVCFDKTGTLTEDGLDLLCVVPIRDKNFFMPVKRVDTMVYNTFLCGLVSCHSLTIIEKQIVGDPLDLKMFESTKWILEEHDVADNSKFDMIYPTVLKPPENHHYHHENTCTDDTGGNNGGGGGGDENDNNFEIGIIREFPFSSSSQRMGVIVRRLGIKHFEYYCKGSPEMILNYVDSSTVPDDFHDVLENYTQEGYRVIALAHRDLKLSYAKVNKIQRENIEKDLTLLGLIVLENRLKPETAPVIQDLNDADIRVIMVTGDNILTALSVARDCDIIPTGQSVIQVNSDNNNPPQLYYTLTNTNTTTTGGQTAGINDGGDVVTTPNYNKNQNSILSNSPSIVSMDTIETQLQNSQSINNTFIEIDKYIDDKTMKNQKGGGNFNNYRFAMTGKVWEIVKTYYPDLVPKLVTRGSVFARMSPEHKQQLVQELQNVGYSVAMCGDGANDCGALKAAHVGISLSETESSVASPFTSKNPNINCVLEIIKEGRAALVTSFSIFKYMAAYSLCQFVSVLILYSIDSNLTDMQFLYIDLFIITIFAFFSGRTESYPGKLVKETPLSSLMSISPILSLLLQMLLVISLQVSAFYHLKTIPGYKPFDASLLTDKDDVKCAENYTIYTVSSFQYIILAIVFSKGAPYRKSIFSNYGLIISTILITAFSIYLTLDPDEFFIKHFELILPSSYTFRIYLLFYGLINLIISIFIELLIIDYFVFKKYEIHTMKTNMEYYKIERNINLDTKWPVLTSDYKSAASPTNPLPPQTRRQTTEILIQVENAKFDKNHILNKIYEESAIDELPFSSLQSSTFSGTYKSFPPTTTQTPPQNHCDDSFDNIADLPYDLTTPTITSPTVTQSLPTTPFKLYHHQQNSSTSQSSDFTDNLSSLNSSISNNLVDDTNFKGLEMNCLNDSSSSNNNR